MDFTPKTRKKKRRLKTPALEEEASAKEEPDPGVHEVTCKGKIGKIDLSKYESGGKGACVLFEDKWVTPNEFERLTGSRAKKYKASLYVNSRPLGELLNGASN